LARPCPCVRRFRPLSSGWASGISTISVYASSVNETQGSCPALPCSGLQPRSKGLLCRLLTSADPSRRLSTTVAHGRSADLPGNALSPSRLCPPHIRPRFPCRYWALKTIALSPSMAASYAISVRRASALPAASFRFHLAVTTLAVRLTVPPAGPVGDLHPQVSAPCRAHNMNEEGVTPLLSYAWFSM